MKREVINKGDILLFQVSDSISAGQLEELNVRLAELLGETKFLLIQKQTEITIIQTAS